MRAPNGAKINLKSALFQRVQIMRIQCKKQGLGGDLILKRDQNQVFSFLQKQLLFHNPAFRLDRKLIIQV